jgi:tetratricopeptide (TPR) repeat protein
VLAARGQTASAIAHFREAVRHDPANLQAQRNFLWYLATSPSSSATELDEAVIAGERAALSRDADVHLLDALAAAYAAGGQFERAVATAERALARTHDAALAAAVRERLALYRQKRPYRAR